MGTNSVKLLVGDVASGAVQPIFETSEQTRLGAGFFETRMLQPEAVAQTAKAAATFTEKARELGALEVRIIATSAARDALNSEVLKEAVKRETGLTLNVISGDQEAFWAFKGVGTDARFASMPLLIMDVGGGSTEFILGKDGVIFFQHSCQMGSVRGLEKLQPSNPPTRTDLEKARQWVLEILAPKIQPELEAMIRPLRSKSEASPVVLIGTGGTSTILAKMQESLAGYDRDMIESAVIRSTALHQRVENLWGMPMETRCGIAGLPANRADVILTGSVIYESVMQVFQFTELRVSTRGLRFAALLARDAELNGP